MKCSVKDCKLKATAFIKGKPVCQKHFKEERWNLSHKKRFISNWLDKHLKKGKSPTKHPTTNIQAPYWRRSARNSQKNNIKIF